MMFPDPPPSWMLAFGHFPDIQGAEWMGWQMSGRAQAQGCKYPHVHVTPDIGHGDTLFPAAEDTFLGLADAPICCVPWNLKLFILLRISRESQYNWK